MPPSDGPNYSCCSYRETLPRLLSFFVAVSRYDSARSLNELERNFEPEYYEEYHVELYVGVLSYRTYQATFRTPASRSIFVMRVDSRARPSDIGRESTTFKAEQQSIIQNDVRHDESEGQARFSNVFQWAHRGTCWMYTWTTFSLDHNSDAACV